MRFIILASLFFCGVANAGLGVINFCLGNKIVGVSMAVVAISCFLTMTVRKESKNED